MQNFMSAPALSVLIVTYRSGPTLSRCLAALKAQSFTDYEVVLVDNDEPGMGDGAAAKATASDPAIRLITPGANLGFAAGNNLAAQAATGRWLVMLNPDAYPNPDWLQRLAEAAARRPAYRVFTSRQLTYEDPSLLDGLGDVMFAAGAPYRGGYHRPDPGDVAEGEVFSPCGAAMMLDRDLFLGLGGFDESFFCYCEDVDLGYRLRLAGERVMLVPDAVVRHEGSVSSGGPASPFAVRYGTRNRMWLLVKNTPWPLIPVLLPLHLALLAVILFTGRRDPPYNRLVWAALKEGWRDLRVPLSSRSAVQATRTAPWWSIAAAMSWNPADLLGRRGVIRPLKVDRSAAA
jgi:N-acetylglucosaminyl-diphospho-decaprenol L-rhamnosyltransferase